MATPCFNDLGKNCRDLLFKGFPTANKVTTNTTTSNGLNVQTCFQRNDDGSVKGHVDSKYFCTASGAETKVHIASNDLVRTEISIKDKLVEGLKTTIGSTFGNDEARSVTGVLEYRQSAFHGCTKVTLPSNNQPKVCSNVTVLLQDNIAAGVDVDACLGDSAEVKKVATSLGYQNSTASITAGLVNRGESMKATAHYHQMNLGFLNGGDFAAQLQYDVKGESDRFELTTGASYKLDSVATIKGRFDNHGKLSLAYSQKLNDFTKVVAGTELNTTNLSSGKGQHKFAVTFAFTD